MKKLNRIGAWLMVCVLLITMIMPADVNAATKVAKPKLQSSKMQTDGSVLVKFVPKSGVNIYYTTNGKKPAPGKSGTKKYSKKGIRLTSTKTIKAVEKKGSQVSAVYSKKFKALKPLDPPKYLGGESGDGPGKVWFKKEPNIEIYYTVNNKTPKVGTPYTYQYDEKTGILLYEEECTVKVIATDGKRVSSVWSQTFIMGEYDSFLAKKELEAKEKAKEIVASLIKPGMDDYTKIQLLHDYIVDNVEYDLGDDETSDYRGTFASALLDGKAVCTGYSLALDLLYEYAGIETYPIGSRAMMHDWNLVKYNGYWYHIDPTFDDIESSNEKRKYRYFLLTDEEMKQDHTWDHADTTPTCNGPHIPKPYEK